MHDRHSQHEDVPLAIITDPIVEARDLVATILDEDDRRDYIDISRSLEHSREALGDYVTLDIPHISEIHHLKTSVRRYFRDSSLRRPLNLMLNADAGSGKSHFVESLARKMPQLVDSYVTFNMANLETVHDLVPALDEARNRKAEDLLPLLFLDEFDSHLDRIPLLLPLLWDGELHLAGRRLKLGRAVIVLAASDPRVQEHAAKAWRADEKRDSEAGKLVDVFSRINAGIITIPDMDEVKKSKDPVKHRDRRVDKICIAVALLLNRFPSVALIPRPLLAYIGLTKFRYAVRSIAHLVDSLEAIDPKSDTLPLEAARFLQEPAALVESGMAYHLHPSEKSQALSDHAREAVDAWQACTELQGTVRLKGGVYGAL